MEYKKISEFTQVITGGTPSTEVKEYWEGGTIPWLQSGCCQNCDVTEASKYITEEGLNNSSAKMMPKDSVLIALTGATAGKVGYLKFDACGNQSITGILPNDTFRQKYIYYFLLNYRESLLRDCVGGAQPHISQAYVKNIKIPFINLEEQDKVVDELETISNLINYGKSQIDSLNNLAKEEFNKRFIKTDCPCVRLDSVSISKGEYGAGSASIEYNENRPRYVRITDINDDGTLNDDAVSSINEEDDNNYKLQYGDFMFARMGATVGKTYAFYKGNEIFAGYLIRYRLDLEKINPRYLFWFTKQQQYSDWVKLNQSGAAQPGINAQKYNSLLIPLASIEEQEKFSNFALDIEEVKAKINKTVMLYQELLKKKMHQYFS